MLHAGKNWGSIFSRWGCMPGKTGNHTSPPRFLSDRTSKHQYESALVRMALSALVAGVVVYLLSRQAGTLFCIPNWLYLDHSIEKVNVLFGDQLPSFLHTYTFILLSAAALSPWPSLATPICAFWFFLESLCEIGQSNMVSSAIQALAKTASFDFPTADRIANYFVFGQFDPLDLLAIMIGCLSALLTIKLAQKYGGVS